MCSQLICIKFFRASKLVMCTAGRDSFSCRNHSFLVVLLLLQEQPLKMRTPDYLSDCMDISGWIGTVPGPLAVHTLSRLAFSLPDKIFGGLRLQLRAPLFLYSRIPNSHPRNCTSLCVLILCFFNCFLDLVSGSKWKPGLVWCR